MKNLSIIIKTEYFTDIRAKSFWISTLLVPALFVVFFSVLSIMNSAYDSFTYFNVIRDFNRIGYNDYGRMVGMFTGMFLSLFIMSYGTIIFNKVKSEKSNRIVEILATCVDGRTMMSAKLISVGILGFTQLLLWGIMIIIASFFLRGETVLDILSIDMSISFLIKTVCLSIIYFIGGFLFYGSMYAACGAMSDRNNENQEYMTVLTFILLLSFYLSIFIVDGNNTSSAMTVMWLLPFTSPTLGCMSSISGTMQWWMIFISVVVLYVCGFLMLILSGKIYTSSLLLRGKKLSIRDIIIFIKSR